jgi:signal transduction histidine kinase
MADLEGNVVADSIGDATWARINTDRSNPFAVFLIEGKPILVYAVPLVDTGLDAIEERFTTGVNRSLLIAIGSAGLVAVLLTLLLSQSILGPVGALISTTRKMGKGDLSQRVDVKGGGELGELANAFNSMADGLARLEKLRQNMVTDVAHELRTPLSNIRGYLEALQDGVIEPSPETIASLHEEAMLLNRLVDNLQELALAEAGQLNLVCQPVHIEDIRVTVKAIDSKVEVSVQDTGIGIAPEHLPYVFERFYRADKSRTRTTGGAGLGLAIVKQLVEAHGGQVGVVSEVGRGTTVTFTSPVAAS